MDAEEEFVIEEKPKKRSSKAARKATDKTAKDELDEIAEELDRVLRGAPSKKGKKAAGQVPDSEILAEKDRRIEVLENELASTRDKLIRLQADFDNYCKQMDKMSTSKEGAARHKMVVPLLDVVDSFDKGFVNVDEEDPFVEGMRMVYDQFLTILARLNVKAIPAKGEKFDPYKHEAFQQVASGEVEPGFIVQEVQKGFMLDDSVLRTSKVIVAKKGAAPAKVEKTKPAPKVEKTKPVSKVESTKPIKETKPAPKPKPEPEPEPEPEAEVEVEDEDSGVMDRVAMLLKKNEEKKKRVEEKRKQRETVDEDEILEE